MRAARAPTITRTTPLRGIPIILKDNIDTKDMPTTAGSVAFAGSIPKTDAFVTKKLKQAGAIILGKATMTEFANFLTNGMPAGYSSLGGYGYNPYDPRPDPRNALDALLPAAERRPSGAHAGRIELGTGHRGGRESRGRRDRNGNVRIDPEPGHREHAGRHQADGGTDQPRRDHSDRRGPGHRRSVRAHGARRGDRARRDDRIRSARSGDSARA